jgi:hypothetical protein
LISFLKISLASYREDFDGKIQAKQKEAEELGSKVCFSCVELWVYVCRVGCVLLLVSKRSAMLSVF